VTDYSSEVAARSSYDASASADGTRSIGEVLADLTRDLSTLVQQEVALAKAEVKQSATRIGQSIGMFAGAAVAGFLFVLFLSIALWWAIGDKTGLGWAALIVAFVWVVIGLVLGLVARAQLKKIRGLEQTADTLSAVPNALKGQEERNR
jgi:ABC-type Fe3+-siderophore transport system permease subunit